MESRQVSRSGQSLMTSISGSEGQIDLKIGRTQTRDPEPTHHIS